MILDRERIEGILKGRLIETYGRGAGLETARVVLPSVLSDFEKTVLASPDGEAEELYRLEDGKAEILLKGKRKEPGKRRVIITEIIFNGVKTELL